MTQIKPQTMPDTDVISQTQSDWQMPDLYAVIMHNDDYTTMDFVVFLLNAVFDKPIEQAYQLMMQIHQTGRAVVAVLPYEIAEMKVDEATSLAEQEQFPLFISIEQA
ncbi:ATP-dependent Clp protease adaptor protein ClpS [Moraxella cuniculi DSM 21768]|uniref:ATP-dependent Clp protease adapter protein ClpS n=1 Tax=Moraxella cuniculi DSM 21768 TaxID=1122245 RepID=A0A1N7EMT2_9GAMM|nr:ATP-dependent Clp protease adaptor ClpS [Moraxella cuniculi]OOS07741.1 Clp protease ClpS [Moraxella cuniculi]SIR89401.1 ATP-dependent Clp protease adaptor protein ClpS [Moraxella cuniculi DSM 21768]